MIVTVIITHRTHHNAHAALAHQFSAAMIWKVPCRLRAFHSKNSNWTPLQWIWIISNGSRKAMQHSPYRLWWRFSRNHPETCNFNVVWTRDQEEIRKKNSPFVVFTGSTGSWKPGVSPADLLTCLNYEAFHMSQESCIHWVMFDSASEVHSNSTDSCLPR